MSQPIQKPFVVFVIIIVRQCENQIIAAYFAVRQRHEAVKKMYRNERVDLRGFYVKVFQINLSDAFSRLAICLFSKLINCFRAISILPKIQHFFKMQTKVDYNG